MRGRTKLVSLATMLAVLLTISMVFATGFVDVSTVSLFSEPPVEPDSPSNDLAVSPVKIIKDYVNDAGYQIGDTFVLHIDVTDAVDLFAYQVNVTWAPAMFNFTGVTYGAFLSGTSSPYGTSSVEDIYMGDNETAYVSIAETILGDYSGESGSGRLVTLSFLITGYGNSTIDISASGTLPTKLLDSTGTAMTFTTASGYFKNKLNGDANGDKAVNILDVAKVNSFWSPPGVYDRDVDTNDDGAVNILDIAMVNSNWGRTAP